MIIPATTKGLILSRRLKPFLLDHEFSLGTVLAFAVRLAQVDASTLR